MARLRDNLTRLSLDAETVVADAAEWAGGNNAEGFDGILVDAPCAFDRHHPPASRRGLAAAGIRHCGADGVAEAAAAKGPSRCSKPGGTLVYCTCSLEAEEGEQAISAFLAAESGVRRAPIDAGEVAGLSEILNAAGDLRTLPCHLPHADPRLSGLDGFLRRPTG